MTKNHLKARAAPRTWNIPRKEMTFVTRPNPGSQPLDRTLPLNLVLRTAGVGVTRKEITYVLTNTPVLVNGVRRYDGRFGVGLFDVVAIPSTKQYFVLSMDDHGRLALETTTEKLAGMKLARVRGLCTVPGGKLQLSLEDGRTVLLGAKDKATYIPGATAIIAIPDGKVASVHPIAPKATVLLTGGKHRGTRGVVAAIDGDSVTVTVKGEPAAVTTKMSHTFVLASGAAGGAQ